MGCAGRVLVMGDEMRIFLAVVRALGRAGHEIHAAPFDLTSPALRSRYVHAVHALPRYQDSAEGWLAGLRALIAAHRIELVIPTCDRAILPLDAHRADLGDVKLAIPNPAAMAEMFDKARTRAMAESLGVPVAPGGLLTPADTAAGLAARYGLPLVIKPRRSYFIDRLDAWGKVYICDDVAELDRVLGLIGDPTRYLAEGFFPGAGVGVSVLAHQGRILQAFQHRRLREGRGGSSSYRISEALDPGLLDAVTRICAHVAYDGVCMFEFRRNLDTGAWVLLETNARFWGSMPLPLSLGVDFPNRLYDLLVQGRTHPPVEYRVGVRSRNLVLDARNLLADWRDLTEGRALPWLREAGDFLLQPVGWMTGRETSDSFVFDDLRPAWAEMRALPRTWRQTRAKRTEPAASETSDLPSGARKV